MKIIIKKHKVDNKHSTPKLDIKKTIQLEIKSH